MFLIPCWFLWPLWRNRLVPGWCAILKMQCLILTDWICISYGNALRWMPWDLADDKSTLVPGMAWCRQGTSHYPNQCWSISMSPYGVPMPEWVNYLEQWSQMIFWYPWCMYKYKHSISAWYECLIFFVTGKCDFHRLGASRQQAITWSNNDPHLPLSHIPLHMASMS